MNTSTQIHLCSKVASGGHSTLHCNLPSAPVPPELLCLRVTGRGCVQEWGGSAYFRTYFMPISCLFPEVPISEAYFPAYFHAYFLPISCLFPCLFPCLLEQQAETAVEAPQQFCLVSLARTGQGPLNFHRPVISVHSEQKPGQLSCASTAQLAGEGGPGPDLGGSGPGIGTVGRVMGETDPPRAKQPRYSPAFPKNTTSLPALDWRLGPTFRLQCPTCRVQTSAP